MRNITFKMIFLFGALMGFLTSTAQQQAPHTVRGESKVSNVSLSWKSPADQQTMQWHNDYDYDGESGISIDGAIPMIVVANRFDKGDLKEYNGMVINSISFFHYSTVLDIYLLIYEDGKVVREEKVDFSGLALNKMYQFELKQPYTVHDDVELMIAVKFVHGPNIDFVAIMDKGPVASGKGDLYSYDGINWMTVNRGNFLVTGHIKKEDANEPDGYQVYRGSTKLNDALITTTDATFADQPKGEFDYSVAAVYGSTELASYPVTITNVPVTEMRPIATNVRSTVDGLNATVAWRSPFTADKELTWCNGNAGLALGTTSGTTRRLWAVNSFSAEEMLSYNNHQIAAINVMLNAEVKEMKLVIFKDGVIDYYEDVPAETVAAIETNKWTKLSLATPYTIKPYTAVRFGYFIIHEKNLYPAKGDHGPAMFNACFIAPLPPNSTKFANYKPHGSISENSFARNGRSMA